MTKRDCHSEKPTDTEIREGGREGPQRRQAPQNDNLLQCSRICLPQAGSGRLTRAWQGLISEINCAIAAITVGRPALQGMPWQ